MKRFLVLLLILLALPSAAWAQRVNQTPVQAASPFTGMGSQDAPAPQAAPVDEVLHDRIAAVVNDNVISTNDIEERMRLALISSGMPPTPEVAQRLLPQILRSLIDEQLQLQEAKRLDISITKDDVEQAMGRIAEQNHIPGGMRDFVKAHGGSPEALEAQIKAGLSWNKVIQRELRPRVEVGDDEIDAVIERIRANAGKEEYLVSEIFLAVDNPKDDEQVKSVADNLVDQIKGGANFGAVARQFSQGAGASEGGDMGWIQEGHLQPELNSALTSLQVGQIAGPIHSTSGYHILGLRDKRTITLGNTSDDITLNLQQAFRPFDDNTTHEALLQEAEQLRGTINDCNNLPAQLASKFPNWHWQNMGDVKQAKLPGWIEDKIQNVQVGKGTIPLSTDKGALIVFVCERHVPEGHVDREAILSSIGTEKMELQARRLMRDLRRAAYVDIRLGNT